MSANVEAREEIFIILCDICVRCGVALPPIEADVVRFWLKVRTQAEHVNRARAIRSEVVGRLVGNRSKSAGDARMFSSMIASFPSVLENFSCIDGRMLTAAINDRLLSLGLEPIRPALTGKRVERLPVSEAGPATLKSVLIVDDEESALLRTARALIGWPNMAIGFFLQNQNDSEERTDNPLLTTAQDILRLTPDLILMDQGLAGIRGSDLIRHIVELTVVPPVFIANTGGDDTELRRAGALTNCDKGRVANGIRQAITRFNR